MSSVERKSTRRPPGRGRPRVTRWIRAVLLILGISVLVLGSGLAVAALWLFTILPRSLPPVTALETLGPMQGARIYDDNDELVTELHVERRIFVPLAQVPQTLRDAIIATEDRRVPPPLGLDPSCHPRPRLPCRWSRRPARGGRTLPPPPSNAPSLPAHSRPGAKL